MTQDPIIDPDLLAIMQCPRCTGGLAERIDPPALVCQACSHTYPVTDGIPVMLVNNDESAPRLTED